MEVIIVAVIVAISSTIAPLLLAWISGRQRRAEKLEDYKRQDEVAARDKAIDKKLDIIHTLVNSNMTKALQAELEAVLAQVVLLREVTRLKGVAPTPELLDSMEVLDDRVSELTIQLKERANAAESLEI